MATSETTPRPDGGAATLAGQHVQGVGDPGHHALGVAEAALPKGVALEASREESALEATRQQIAALGVMVADALTLQLSQLDCGLFGRPRTHFFTFLFQIL